MSKSKPTDQVSLFPTTTFDLDSVVGLERHPENRPYVGQWTRQQHGAAMSHENTAHFVVRTPSDDVIGYVILAGIQNPDRSVELKRIVIGEKGKGYGRAVVKLVKDMVFLEYDAHRLWLDVMEHNGRAYALYLSEGFTEEGLLRECLKKGDKFISVRVMSILEDEYNRSS